MQTIFMSLKKGLVPKLNLEHLICVSQILGLQTKCFARFE